jgi:hypothetical protein
MKRKSQAYDHLACEALIEVLKQEHAVVWREVEAKLAERPYLDLENGLEPHHLLNARHLLISQGKIEEIPDRTRGGETITVLGLSDRRHSETVFAKTAQRKRVLQARYQGWARASKHWPNMIGEAGERVANESLRTAARETLIGYGLQSSPRRQISNLFGKPIPRGPLDNAAFFTPFDNNKPPTPITLLIEVKNGRRWIYPSAVEPFQLLEKAILLQRDHPNDLFLPVFICRRAHFTLFHMAKDLGFLVLQTKEQPILPHSKIAKEKLQEVCSELGYNLIQTDGPLKLLVKRFKETIPKHAVEYASQWRETAQVLAQLPDAVDTLRDSSAGCSDRDIAREIFYKVIVEKLGVHGKWGKKTWESH